MSQHGRGVYRFPAVGSVRLVGIKSSGRVAFELTVPEDDYHPSMLERAWKWLDRMDPQLRLISSDRDWPI